MKRVVVCLVVLAGTAITASVSPEQAAAFQRKLSVIVQQGETPSVKERPTTVTEDEVNAYLRYSAGDQVPAGVTEPTITIVGQGRLSGRAVVDLDAVRHAGGHHGLFNPLRLLRGRLPITASGVLHTRDGKGRFELAHAAVGGVPIPKPVLQEIVNHYSRSDDFPNGINIDDPFELPAAIRRIEVGEKQAVIVQ